MSFITGWIINIIVFMLLAMIVDMLLPDTDIKKYAKLTTGLLLFAIILSPLFALFNADFDDMMTSFQASFQDQPLSFSVEEKKKEIQASQRAYTLEQLAIQLKDLAEKELIEQFGMNISHIEVRAREEDIEKITVHLQKGQAPIISIKPVDIALNEEEDTDIPLDANRVKEFLSNCWDIPMSKLDIVAEGRSRKDNE